MQGSTSPTKYDTTAAIIARIKAQAQARAHSIVEEEEEAVIPQRRDTIIITDDSSGDEMDDIDDFLGLGTGKGKPHPATKSKSKLYT